MPAFYLEIALVVLGLVLLMVEAFGPSKSKTYLGWLSLTGVLAIFAALFTVCPSASCSCDQLTRFYEFDSQAKFYKGFALITTALVILLSLEYRGTIKKFTTGTEEGSGEFYILPLFACAGMMLMASAKDLISIFVAIELVTITFYILVAYMRRNVGSLEAGVKYLILGALSTGILVYGIAWIYGITGTTELALIAERIPSLEGSRAPLLFGLALMVLAIGFKIGAVPMQLWIPDVYQGAPTPITAFLSVGSKAAGFAVALRLFEPFFGASLTSGPLLSLLLVLAALTILVGNLAALAQKNFKRLLGYSSIANAGFLLLAMAAWQPQGSESALSTYEVVSFYLITYLIMTMAAFFFLVTVYNTTGKETIASFNGLAKRNPLLALIGTIILSSLAGLPLTAGFYGKFYVFKSAISAASSGHPALWWAIAFGLVGAAAGFYYYFQTIRAMYWNDPKDPSKIPVSKISLALLVIAALALVVFGFYPQPLLDLAAAK